ncbi:thioredoxin family protein [Haloferax mediterranei ATCC 33500]|uniref:Alkyl hydroperoxide reductase n=1 Tax=Haloferax mediterranei (strain ATCC 33500 / DSM 1411 / JCM 8866 / NBRC 14739 / NCIMB 2177 / R-4) TaxID=523841 RepID=I3R411_HALMT|nr:thioredoxin family protein [Haloferax mediterranei]AFK18971.1 Peroxiredoxin [Haloferax mediterranei ATCC 33500]AHZ21668.1 alkyl hydroperoxide reductase [Haloferax mediterranei ATCC 33500]EMA03171.1 peroxiredoxin [Haloferax mediterranei ATCC 33500]MDX5989062.1 thioredoxin family protein [Haloferax mediterranei ATCC 33500]QCQ75453.1 thioredoxin family protein [Haloferax mediterranei ATCC 33500]
MVLLESDSELEHGDTAPDFELPGTDGETYSLSSFEGYGAVLVVFTCNHCPYAQAKFDELNHLAEVYDDLAVVGINPNDAEAYPDDSFDRMKELADDGTIQYTAYLRDESQDVAAEYGAVCTPDPFLFENTDDGFELVFHSRIDDAMSPDDEVTDYEMRDAVESLLAGEDIPVEETPSQGCSIKWKDD